MKSLGHGDTKGSELRSDSCFSGTVSPFELKFGMMHLCAKVAF